MEAASVYPQLQDRAVKNTICLFDVDDTLTPARRVCTFSPALQFFQIPPIDPPTPLTVRIPPNALPPLRPPSQMRNRFCRWLRPYKTTRTAWHAVYTCHLIIRLLFRGEWPDRVPDGGIACGE